MTAGPTLALLTRVDCHLCEVAAADLRATGVPFATIDVDTDPALQARFGDAVPVLLLQGEELCRAPVSRAGLAAALREAGIAAGA
jgi:hypothetical protein